jgi:putative hydrolase of the HAD superfamily
VRGIIFDGDDTLWQTEPLYDNARQAARSVVERAGLDGAAWEEFERMIDVKNVDQLGLGVDRFPTSCLQAYEELCQQSDLEIDRDVCQEIDAAARAVFTKPAPLAPHARETLTKLRRRGLRLGLLTKGDVSVQRRRIEQSGLADLFDVIHVVDIKTPEDFTLVLDRLGVDPASALSVGNSVRSDVIPALAAGLLAVWIDAHVWEYERMDGVINDERVVTADDLSDVLEVARQ